MALDTNGKLHVHGNVISGNALIGNSHHAAFAGDAIFYHTNLTLQMVTC